MRTKPRFRVLRWALILVGLALLYPLTFIVFEGIYGGPHVVSTGVSHGIRIGMTKREVLERYKALEKSVNLRTLRSNTESDGFGVLALEPTELVLTPKWEASDHWMGYRSEYPVHFQEYFFAGGILTNIVNYIRFYETP